MIREDYKKELELFPHTVKVGEKGSGYSKKIQEWLCLHKYHTQGFRVTVEIDDWYGRATASAVKTFQELKGLETTGEVDNETWITLTAPMMRAFKNISFGIESTIQDRLIAYMNQIVEEHPTELSNNTGPWVRSFMKGKEGDWAAWCAGLVSTGLDLASSSMNKKMDKWVPWSWSTGSYKVNALASDHATYLDKTELTKGSISNGDLFLVMNGTKPRHIGIVIGNDNGVYSTLEGNTNDEGSREGYEACERRRNLLNGKYSIIKLK
jgi:hypothetical protein